MFSVLVMSTYSILVLFVEFGSLQIFEIHALSSLVSLILLIHISNGKYLGQAALRRYFPL